MFSNIASLIINALLVAIYGDKVFVSRANVEIFKQRQDRGREIEDEAKQICSRLTCVLGNKNADKVH